jgi:hypothetical protein
MAWRGVAGTGFIWLSIGTRRALLNTIMNLRFPYNTGEFLSSFAAGGFSRRTQLHVVTEYDSIECLYEEVQGTFANSVFYFSRVVIFFGLLQDIIYSLSTTFTD